VVALSLGGTLVYQAASSLGNQGSSAQHWPGNWWVWALLLTLLFVALIALGQVQVNHPQRLPWLFPFTNIGIVSIPSAVIAAVVARRYARFNPFAWPVSWREWTSGVIYGAIGATTIGGLINSLYLGFMGAFLISQYGEGDAFDLANNLPTLPRGLGVAFDLSVLSVCAPVNEEFWKGLLVALFFFRRGGAGRCLLWGVLAGAGFNLFETFGNSLAVVNPEQVSDQTIGDDWWLFATARAGTSAPFVRHRASRPRLLRPVPKPPALPHRLPARRALPCHLELPHVRPQRGCYLQPGRPGFARPRSARHKRPGRALRHLHHAPLGAPTPHPGRRPRPGLPAPPHAPFTTRISGLSPDRQGGSWFAGINRTRSPL